MNCSLDKTIICNIMPVWLWLWTHRGCLFLLAHFCNTWIITLLFIDSFIGQWITQFNLLTIVLCDHTVLSHIKGFAEILTLAYLLEDGTLFNLIADYRNNYRKVIQSIPLRSEIHLCHFFFSFFFLVCFCFFQEVAGRSSPISPLLCFWEFSMAFMFFIISKQGRAGKEKEVAELFSWWWAPI